MQGAQSGSNAQCHSWGAPAFLLLYSALYIRLIAGIEIVTACLRQEPSQGWADDSSALLTVQAAHPFGCSGDRIREAV